MQAHVNGITAIFQCCTELGAVVSLAVWNVLSVPQGQAQYLYNSMEVWVVQSENVFSHINMQVVNLILWSPYFPFISLSWREKGAAAGGENGSPMEGKVLGSTTALCMLLKVNGSEELLNTRCVQWVEGVQRGPGGVTWVQDIWELRGASVVRVVDYCHERIPQKSPRKWTDNHMLKANAPWVCPMPLLLISGCGADVGTARP